MAEEELQVGDFNPDTYEHVLPEGAHDFDDYDTDYKEENPELGYTDQQVQEIVEKMGKIGEIPVQTMQKFSGHLLSPAWKDH